MTPTGTTPHLSPYPAPCHSSVAPCDLKHMYLRCNRPAISRERPVNAGAACKGALSGSLSCACACARARSPLLLPELQGPLRDLGVSAPKPKVAPNRLPGVVDAAVAAANTKAGVGHEIQRRGKQDESTVQETYTWYINIYLYLVYDVVYLPYITYHPRNKIDGITSRVIFSRIWKNYPPLIGGEIGIQGVSGIYRSHPLPLRGPFGYRILIVLRLRGPIPCWP